MVASPTATPPPPPPLLPRVAGGDEAAVREVLARYGGIVWSLARRSDPQDAEDAVQEIFLDLWKSAARFDPAIASELAFIAMIARRRLIDRRRARARRPRVDPLDQALTLADASVAPDIRAEAAMAVRALEQLRPDPRLVLLLGACQGMSHGEIAAETGFPLGTVKAHARRGLIAIRAALLGDTMEEVP